VSVENAIGACRAARHSPALPPACSSAIVAASFRAEALRGTPSSW